MFIECCHFFRDLPLNVKDLVILNRVFEKFSIWIQLLQKHCTDTFRFVYCWKVVLCINKQTLSLLSFCDLHLALFCTFYCSAIIMSRTPSGGGTLWDFSSKEKIDLIFCQIVCKVKPGFNLHSAKTWNDVFFCKIDYCGFFFFFFQVTNSKPGKFIRRH